MSTFFVILSYNWIKTVWKIEAIIFSAWIRNRQYTRKYLVVSGTYHAQSSCHNIHICTFITWISLSTHMPGASNVDVILRDRNKTHLMIIRHKEKMLKDSNAENFLSPPPSLPPMDPQHFFNIFRYGGLFMIYDMYPLFILSVWRFSTCSQTTVQVSKDTQILNTLPTATQCSWCIDLRNLDV